MADLEKALTTQLANIEKRTGRSIAELTQLVERSTLTKHSELVTMLKRDLGMGHGDANTLVHTVRQAKERQGQDAGSEDDALDRLYTGRKGALRPIHEKLLAVIRKLGDFETAAKKTYVSYRRKKQFAMIGPATKTAVELGLNMKGVEPTERLEALPPGKMCQYRVRIADPKEVDKELVGWLRTAYDAAG